MNGNRSGERRYGLRIAISAIIALAAFIGGVLIFVVVLPERLGESCPNITEWLLEDTEQLSELLGGASSITMILVLKAVSWVLTAVALIALFFLGASIQKKKPKFNDSAEAVGKSFYLLAFEIFKMLPDKIPDEVFSQVRTLAEKLRTESDFGRSNDEITRCENEIYRSLKELKNAVIALSKGNVSENEVIRICRSIEGRLAIRREMLVK